MLSFERHLLVMIVIVIIAVGAAVVAVLLGIPLPFVGEN